MILGLCFALAVIPCRAQANVIDDKKAEIARLEEEIKAENAIVSEIDEAISTATIDPNSFNTLTQLDECLTDVGAKHAITSVDTYDEEVAILQAEKFKHESLISTDTSMLEQLQAEVDNFGACVIEYAAQFEGNRYVWGGTDLENGIDCSGFVMRVYEHFGYDLPHSSAAQRSVGYAVDVDDMQLGDIICYSGHVGLYAGDGMMINASNSAPYPRGGIKYSEVQYSKILAVRRISE